jgi:hypothetical protein
MNAAGMKDEGAVMVNGGGTHEPESDGWQARRARSDAPYLARPAGGVKVLADGHRVESPQRRDMQGCGNE